MLRASPHPFIERFRLVAITDAAARPWPDLERAAREAVAAGLPALILRDLALTDAELAPAARRLRDACREAGALFLLNRRIELAAALAADGVHLGKAGPTPADARAALGNKALIGYSAHSPDEARRAFQSGANYVFFSPIFDTPSKRGLLEPAGLKALGDFARDARGPVIALGGITDANAGEVVRAGAFGVAVIRAIFGAAQPAEATRALLRVLSLETKTPI